MPYPEEMVAPMRAEVTELGVGELRSAEDVQRALGERGGTALYFVNSVCGCAAGSARPGLRESLAAGPRPDRMYTVFAGNDVEATAELRNHLLGYPPSSPFFALFKDGDLVGVLERHDVQGLSGEELAERLRTLYAVHCG